MKAYRWAERERHSFLMSALDVGQLNTPGEKLRYLLNKRPCEPQMRCALFGEKKNLSSLLGIEAGTSFLRTVV
jgi:hypothetical protein